MGVVVSAIIIAFILYVPRETTTDNLSGSGRYLKEEALSHSQRMADSAAEEQRDHIDTVYIYEQREPLIVHASMRPDTASPSLADVGSPKSEARQPNAGEQLIEEDMMEAFEQAFNKVVEQEKENKDTEISKKAEPENRSVDHGIISEGMILDETQTRMGGTFFNYFYNHWQAPREATNFMITIKEKMMPSIGSSVSIKINEELVFQTRLQPRYDFIEQMGQRAVAICYRRLQQTSNSEYYQVY